MSVTRSARRPKGRQFKYLTHRCQTIYYVRRVGRDRLYLSIWGEAAGRSRSHK